MMAPGIDAVRTAQDVADATVFVVDDDCDVRRGIALLVRSVGLACEAYASAQQFLEQYDPGKLGCLILDIRMPDMSGLELQRELRTKGLWLPIIFVTAHAEVPMATQAMRAGAVDFIQKPFSPQVLLERVHEAISLERDRNRKRTLAAAVQQRITRLTEREQEVMKLLAVGESAKTIAHRLAISHKTVENHRTKILEKMHVDNPTQLAHLLSLIK